MTWQTDTVAAALADPPRALLRGASLFLDFDGTLVEFAPRPDAVVVEARVRRVLVELQTLLAGRVAIVTGRPAAEVAAFFPDMALAIGGSHGSEILWPGGGADEGERPEWIADAAVRGQGLADVHPGVMIEVKPFGIAIHYRAAPEAEATCRALAEELAGPDVHLQPGKMVIELRQAGADKGSAVAAFLADPRMAGTRPIVLGDDLTDEAAFAAAAARGGAGVLVGPERETAAQYRLEGVTATLDWLEAAMEAMR